MLKHLNYADKNSRKALKLKKSPIMDDLRVLDLYEDAIIDGVPLAERRGNWVQKFRSTDDGSLFVTAQFSRYQEVEEFIRENFKGGAPLPRKRGAS